jgi:hypothetical protein
MNVRALLLLCFVYVFMFACVCVCVYVCVCVFIIIEDIPWICIYENVLSANGNVVWQ